MRVLVLRVFASIAASVAFGNTPFKGTVVDSADTPIASVMVLIHWDSAGSTVGLRDNIGITEDIVLRSKQDGTFTVDLPPGFYDVFVSVPAFTPTSRKVRVKAGKAQEISLRLDPDPLYTAEMGSRVETVPPKR